MIAPVEGSQASVVHALPSSIETGLWNTPVEVSQPSSVQALPSSVFTGLWNTPVEVSQPSSVQAFPSSVETAVWVIKPVEELQASVVQALLSSVFTGLWKIPVEESQPSVVQALPSSVLTGVWKTPATIGFEVTEAHVLPTRIPSTTVWTEFADDPWRNAIAVITSIPRVAAFVTSAVPARISDAGTPVVATQSDAASLPVLFIVYLTTTR